MDNFKIKSIDEFDLDFVAKIREQNQETENSDSGSLIPEIIKDDAVDNNNENFENSYFKMNDAVVEDEPEYIPTPQEETAKTPRPLVPISSAYSPVGAPRQPISEDDFGDDDESEAKNKKGTGALIGKIVSIILLAATIVVFILGCFVTIFLDNNGSDIGGICFNTISADVYDDSNALILSKGDLVISKKVESVSEYTSGMMIAVPSAIEEGKCDVHIVQYANGTDIVTSDITSPYASYSSSVPSESCYGIVNSYIPVLGGLLHFAMDNAVLVCVLFILLAALWCLILVLIENKKPKIK